MSFPQLIDSYEAPRPPGKLRLALRYGLETLLVIGVFALHGAWATPDVNETHYLAKAKHYWDPSWCPQDFFLQTADAHATFYWAFGWTTQLMSMTAAAWLGRVLCWVGLAIAWQRLSRAIAPGWGWAVLSAALVVGLNERLHMAGEWFVGGVEAKTFAYIFVLLGLERLLRGRWPAVWILFGLAAALHVVVGMWACIGAGVVWLVSKDDRPPLKRMWPWLLAGFVLSLPGLLPAALLSRGVDEAITQHANEIYVAQRLPHHLSSQLMKPGFVGRQLALWGAWLILITVVTPVAGERRLRWFIGSTILIAICGFLLTALQSIWPEEANALLRLYWYRAADFAVALGVALSLVAMVLQLRRTNEAASRAWLALLLALVAVDSAQQALHLPVREAAMTPRSDKGVAHRDWVDACQWIAANTPPDALFFTPNESTTFKWYAQRGEVVTWKDLPQDPPGIVEWWKRLNEVHGYPYDALRNRTPDQLPTLPAPRLRQLATKYKAGYAVLLKLPGVTRDGLELVYQNSTYGVYRLPPLP